MQVGHVGISAEQFRIEGATKQTRAQKGTKCGTGRVSVDRCAFLCVHWVGCTGSRTNWFLGVRTRRKHRDQGEGKAHDKGASVWLVRLVQNSWKYCENIGVGVGCHPRDAVRYEVVSAPKLVVHQGLANVMTSSFPRRCPSWVARTLSSSPSLLRPTPRVGLTHPVSVKVGVVVPHGVVCIVQGRHGVYQSNGEKKEKKIELHGV